MVVTFPFRVTTDPFFQGTRGSRLGGAKGDYERAYAIGPKGKALCRAQSSRDY